MHVTRGAERILQQGGTVTVLHASPADGATQLTVLEQTHQPGATTPTHQHHGSEETITVIDGRGEFWAGEQTVELTTGETIVIPPHTWHGFRNVGEHPLRIIASIAGGKPLVEYEADPGTAIEVGSAEWRSHWSAD